MRRILQALDQYAASHPRAEIEIYRQNSVSIRVRVVDPEFKGKSRAQREDELWAIFDKLPDEVVAEISLVLLLTPDEAKKSFANHEFDNPIPSKLWFF
jgi:stress-induced morphogen